MLRRFSVAKKCCQFPLNLKTVPIENIETRNFHVDVGDGAGETFRNVPLNLYIPIVYVSTL
jgi:hypothetical protein